MDVTIRKTSASDVQTIVDIFKSSEPRKISLDEIRTWMLLDPEGFFVAETNGSELIGTCSGIRLSPDEGILGHLWVAEGFRSRGVGSKLGRTALKHLGDRNVAVRGVKACADIYAEKYLFSHQGDKILFFECHGHRPLPQRRRDLGMCLATLVEGRLLKIENSRGSDVVNLACTSRLTADIISKVEDLACTSRLTADIISKVEELGCTSRLTADIISKVEDLACTSKITADIIPKVADLACTSRLTADIISKVEDLACISRLTADIISKVEAYDRSLRSINLSVVVRKIFFWKSCKTSVVLANGKVIGFGFLRPVLTGQWMVSPWYADSKSVAEFILFDLLDGFSFLQRSEGICVRFPEKNAGCFELLKKFGFQDTCFSLDTRFTKRVINQDVSKIYSYYSPPFCTE